MNTFIVFFSSRAGNRLLATSISDAFCQSVTFFVTEGDGSFLLSPPYFTDTMNLSQNYYS
jgi:hypothetical protein